MNLQFLKQVHWLWLFFPIFMSFWKEKFVLKEGFGVFSKIWPHPSLENQEELHERKHYFKKNFRYFKKIWPPFSFENQEILLKSQVTDWIMTMIEIMTLNTNWKTVAWWIDWTSPPWTILATSCTCIPAEDPVLLLPILDLSIFHFVAKKNFIMNFNA